MPIRVPVRRSTPICFPVCRRRPICFPSAAAPLPSPHPHPPISSMATNGQLESGNRQSALLCDCGAPRWWSYGSYLPTPHDKKQRRRVERTTASCLASVRSEGVAEIDVIRPAPTRRHLDQARRPIARCVRPSDSPHSGHGRVSSSASAAAFFVHADIQAYKVRIEKSYLPHDEEIWFKLCCCFIEGSWRQH